VSFRICENGIGAEVGDGDMTPSQRTMQVDGKLFRRYVQRAFLEGKEQGATDYADWFPDDETAAQESKKQLEEQGYSVARVEVTGDTVCLHLGQNRQIPDRENIW
jgi:hypothetical protein